MADAARQGWAMKVLSIDSHVLSSRDGLERARQRSVELYKRHIQGKRESDAKKVLEAFEVLKRVLKPHSRPAPAPAAEAVKRPAPAANNQEVKPPRSQPPQAGPPTPRPMGHYDSAPASNNPVCPLGAKPLKVAKTDKADSGGIFAGSSGEQPICGTSRILGRAASGLFCACGKTVDIGEMGQEPKLVDGRYFCPECRIRTMDPFKPLLEGARGLMKLALMKPPLIPAGARNVASFKFQLDVPNLKEWRKKGQQVEVRMCRLDTCEALQAWPTAFTCSVNGAAVVEIKAPKAGQKRRDVPKVISAELHSGRNMIEVRLEDVDVRRFVFTLCRSEPKSPAGLIKEIGALPSEKCRGRITELLFRSKLECAGEDVQADGYDRCSLFCPVTQARMEIPIRGYDCRHLQCFDLKAYVATNYRIAAFNKRWLCPVCSFKLRPPKELFIDRHIMKILAETESDDLEVAFNADGTWRVTAKYEEPSPLSSDEADACDKPPVEVTLEDDDDDDAVVMQEPQASPGPETLGSPAPEPHASPAQASPPPEVIDQPDASPPEQPAHEQRLSPDTVLRAGQRATPVLESEAIPVALQKAPSPDASPVPDPVPSPVPSPAASPGPRASPAPTADAAPEATLQPLASPKRPASPVRQATPVTLQVRSPGPRASPAPTADAAPEATLQPLASSKRPVTQASPILQLSPAASASPEPQGSPPPQGSPVPKAALRKQASSSGQQARPLFNNTPIKMTGMVRQARPSAAASSAFRGSPGQQPSPAPATSSSALSPLPRACQAENALNARQPNRGENSGSLPRVTPLPPAKLSSPSVSVFEGRPAAPPTCETRSTLSENPVTTGAEASRNKPESSSVQIPPGKIEKSSKKEKKEKHEGKEKKEKKKKRRRTDEEMVSHKAHKSQTFAASMLAEARETNGHSSALQAGSAVPPQIASSPMQSVDLIDSSSEENGEANVPNVANHEASRATGTTPPNPSSSEGHAEGVHAMQNASVAKLSGEMAPNVVVPAALASPVSAGDQTPSLSPDVGGQNWDIEASPVVAAASDSEDGNVSDSELGQFLQSALLSEV